MQENIRYVINPCLRMKKDENKCVIYRLDDFFHAVDAITIITSKEAVLLALFDGKRTFQENVKIFFYIQNREYNKQEALKETNQTLANLVTRVSEEILVAIETVIEKNYRVYDPSVFIIPKCEENACPYDLRLSYPLSVNFNVMTSCAFHCIYCYHPLCYVPPLLTLERFEEIVKELVASGCESMMLAGGDPCLRSDFIELCKILHKNGLFYSISTKSILTREQIEELVYNCGLHKIQLSVDTNKRDIISKLIGCKQDYLDKLEAMVDNLHELGVEVRIKAVLTSLNCTDLENFLNYAYNRLYARNIHVVQYGRSGTRHQDYLFPTQEQLDVATIELQNFKKKNKDCQVQGGEFSIAYNEPVKVDDNFFTHRGICNAGRFMLTLLPNGEVTVCEQLPYDSKFIIGDLSTQSLYECWNGPKIKAWLTPPPREVYPKNSACNTCPQPQYNTCHTVYSRCLRFIWETTKQTDTPDIKCPMANYEKYRTV